MPPTHKGWVRIHPLRYDQPMMTSRLGSLINELKIVPDRTLAQEVLLACLERLGSGGPTEWEVVEVFNAWTDGDALCIVYSAPWGPTVGLRLSTERPIADDPTECGRTIADFDIAEPLGTIADHLVYDDDGMGWWGDLPVREGPPAAP